MFNNKKILGLITARGGSKGLPNKNILNFCGKPLIVWTIEQGLASSLIDDLIVSTDNKDIHDIAVSAGANAPFKRPTELSSDKASSLAVIKHALMEQMKFGKSYDAVVILEPTSPLREPKDIDESVKILFEKNYHSVLSVGRSNTGHPDFLFEKSDSGSLVEYGKQKFVSKRRQDLKNVYFLEGCIYTLKTKKFLKQNKVFFENKTFGLVLDEWKNIEIDDIYDFLSAEAIMKYRMKIKHE